MLTPLSLAAIHYLVLTLLLIAGALAPVFMFRGQIVETFGTIIEAGLLWHLGRIMATSLGETQVALVSYAPFIGATVAFVLMAIGLALYEGLAGLKLLDYLPARLQRLMIWLFAPTGTGEAKRTGEG